MADEGVIKNDSAEILYERIRMLEKKNQCLKTEIKNQQAVIEMLIRNDKCIDEWKTVKTKFESNTNIVSPSSLSPKNPLPVDLQNQFDNLIVTQVNQIEIHEPQDHTPTNHHKRCEITNTKSKLRAEKNNSRSIRPSNAITANENNTQGKNTIRTVPGNQSYAGTIKHNKKTCIISDSHIRRINKYLFNNSIIEGKAQLNSFSGATINRLDHFITPILEETQPDIVIIHVGSNDITHNLINNTDAKGISKRIIDIGKKCLLYGVKEVIISSIFIKRHFELTRIIKKVNDHLRDECRSNKFHFIRNDNITNECLWKDRLHLNNEGTYIFASNLVDFLNGFIFFNRDI